MKLENKNCIKNNNFKNDMKFDKYNLALFDKKDNMIYSSDKKGLRPILDATFEFNKIEINNDKIVSYERDLEYDNLILYDKVFGLAATKVIVAFPGFVKEVHTLACSKYAKNYLEENGIVVFTDEIVDGILNNERTDICPMEKKVINEEIDDIKFYFYLLKKFMIINR
jgi:hypothetical protein